MRPPLILAALALIGLAPGHALGDEPAPALFRDDFERDLPTGWTFTDPAAWRIAWTGEGGRALELFAASKYEPKVRSPLNIALIEGKEFGAFDLKARVRSTVKDYGHRDLCIILGHVDPSHFYYVHIAKAADPHAHSIFAVDGAPRVSIAETRTDGVEWGDGWHEVRVVREPDSGLIEVYFDDLESPIMTARDKRFAKGAVGLGSFDDRGMFDEVTIRPR